MYELQILSLVFFGSVPNVFPKTFPIAPHSFNVVAFIVFIFGAICSKIYNPKKNKNKNKNKNSEILVGLLFTVNVRYLANSGTEPSLRANSV